MVSIIRALAAGGWWLVTSDEHSYAGSCSFCCEMKIRLRFRILFALSGFALNGCHSDVESVLGQMDGELAELHEQWADLPPFKICSLPGGVSPFSLAIHGLTDHWVQVDLGKVVTPDLVAMIPNYQADGRPFGFPAYFSMSLSDSEDFAESEILCDFRATGYQVPESTFPLIGNDAGISGQFLRLTIHLPPVDLNPKPRLEDLYCRLSELMVFSGAQNVAIGGKVTSSHPRLRFNESHSGNLFDGWSQAGLPEDPRYTSACEGYHSRHNEGREVHEPSYWVGVDLGGEFSIDQVNLIPVTPHRFSGNDGFCFPEHFVLEVSTTADFAESKILLDYREKAFPNPGGALYSVSTNGARGRYLRMKILKLMPQHWGAWLFTLGEMQVISGDEIVSEGKEVLAYKSFWEVLPSKVVREISLEAEHLNADELTKQQFLEDHYFQKFERGELVWAKWGLVDGFSSKYALIPVPEWLKKVNERARLEEVIAKLSGTRLELAVSEVVRTEQRQIQLIAVLMIVVVGAGLIFLVRGKLQRHRIRAQLAQDLHDDLSSDLCNISLMSQLLQEDLNESKDIGRNRLHDLEKAAKKALDSIRHLVFLTRENSCPVHELIARLEISSQEQLKTAGIDLTFRSLVKGEENDRISGARARCVLLVCKEALTNVMKHSEASALVMKIHRARGKLSLEIRDDGIGMELESGDPPPHFGLDSMRIRVKKLGGTFAISSNHGSGTSVKFSIPLGR